MINKEEGTAMSSISIIGTGHMARILGTLAVEGGNAVEVIGRDPGQGRRPGRARPQIGHAVLSAWEWQEEASACQLPADCRMLQSLVVGRTPSGVGTRP